MNKICLILILLLAFGLKVQAQVDYYGKIETGFLRFQMTTVNVDPGPNWKGYHLNDEQNGVAVNVINGMNFNHKIFTGIGVGYLNFEGIHGFSIFTDFEYLPLNTKLTPLFNLKIGYNHIWNQYKNGNGSALIELGVGLNYKLTAKYSIYVQSGYLFTQQASFVPLRIGFRF